MGPPPTDAVGGTHLDHDGHRIWWGASGEDGSGVPLLTVHGGPAIPHDYLLPLTALADERRVVFYDQYGCGLSDRADDPTDYTIDLFVDELARVREAAGLERVHLLAHSYGGALALEYALRHPDSGVASLTLSNSFGSMAGLVDGWQQRLDELEPEQASALRSGESESEEYGAALGAFWGRFVLPGPPHPLLEKAQSAMGAEVYARMHGSSWFSPDGQWADWDGLSRISQLDVPLLAISGVLDQCVPSLSEALADAAPQGEVVVLDGAHIPILEDTEGYLAVVRDFLTRVEGSTVPR